MKKRILLMATLALPVIFLAVWAASVEYKIKHAQEITIRAEGFDPRSLISGHYLSLRLNWQETDCRQFSDNLCHPSRFQSVYNYYLPEGDALYLDKVIRRENLTLELVFAYPADKQPHLKHLLINGQNWEQWLKQKRN